MINSGDVIKQNSNDRSADTPQVPRRADNAGNVQIKRDAPFFVVGAHRSGTTLLRFMLSSHPRLYLPPESEFIPAFFGRTPTRSMSRAESQRILEKIFRLRFVCEWRGARPDIDELVPDGETITPARLLDALYTCYARQHGAERWGDKTPTYGSHIDTLHCIFPEAKFIHLIRDGRDVALSVIDTWRQRAHVDLVFAARTWNRRMDEARSSASRLRPDLWLELRYEDLVTDLESELRRICRFLGEAFHPDMARHHLAASQSIEKGGFHDAVRHPTTSARVGRWRTEMSARDLRVFEAIAGGNLTRTGYRVASPGTLTVTEHGRIGILSLKYALYRLIRNLLQKLGLRMPN